MTIDRYYGVDFSGAKLAGRNIWIAGIAPSVGDQLPVLTTLERLEDLCGDAERDCSLPHLVNLIRASEQAVWGIDFPFGLPIEIFPAGHTWKQQIDYLRNWPDGANAIGLEFVARARKLGDKMHIRRQTDTEAKTPFDCYHYRIIYQTFHGMRDVLLPLAGANGTAILPFQYRKLPSAKRVVVESCPSSTLKRLGLPHQNYKQPAGGRLTAKRRATRKRILEGLAPHVAISDAHHRIIMRNPGGDALDAVIAAVGTMQAWHSADHHAIAKHARYPREGRLYT